MNIYTVEQARTTILKRRAFNRQRYSLATLERTAAFFGQGITPPQAVELILRSVEEQGDTAVRKWSALLDRYTGSELVVSQQELQQAWLRTPPEAREAMQSAAERIRRFHQQQPVQSWLTTSLGGQMGQRISPIAWVGVYVPGGTAPLPSSLLMSVIPARVAGVAHVAAATPPEPADAILAAAYLCEVDVVYRVGGAQAIAALAFGTESIQPVDKIVGAGNLFVTLAKQQLYGVVGLDGLAGPTETLVIADHTARPAWVAADLLAQAEHDMLASAILLTPDPDLAHRVQAEVDRQMQSRSRQTILAVSLENSSGIVLTESLEQAAELASDYAAEHCCLAVADPQALMNRIHNAGGFFLGEHSCEALGDYCAGPSHVMPTGGTARFASPLNVLDFVKMSSVIDLDPAGARQLYPLAASLSDLEGLDAHAAAARIRMEAP
jgi:histidinol dehydrogenase